MPRTIIKLTDFDPQPIIEYAISSTDITNVYHYLLAMQQDFWPGTWEDICIVGVKINIGALVQANAHRQTDWDDLFDSHQLD